MRNASMQARRFVSAVGALAVVATGIATAAGTAGAAPPPVRAVAYRLTATMTPGQVVPAIQAPASAAGHFRGVLLRSGAGATRLASLAGCKVVQPPRRSGLPTRLNCGGAAVTLPSAFGQWRLIWRITYTGLSGPATSAGIHMAPAGHNAPAAFPMCAPCAPISQGSMTVTSDQATSLLGNSAYVQVATAAHPDGEIRGQIVRAQVGFHLGR
jgi:hypothetical protein